MQILPPLKAILRFRPKSRVIGSFIFGWLFVLPLCKAQIDVYGVLTGINTDPGFVAIFDTQTNAQLGSPITTGGYPQGSAITPDGLYAYTANFGTNTVSVIDLTTRTLIGTISGIGSGPEAITVSPNNQFAYVTNSSNTVSVIDVSTNKVVGAPIPVGVEPIGVAVSPDGQSVYVSDFQSGSVSVINSATRSVVATISGVGIDPFNLAFSPDGRFVYVVNESSNNVAIINTATHQLVGTIPVGAFPLGIAFTPDGRFAYVTSQFGSVSVIATATETVIATISTGAGTSAWNLSITPDGKFAYVTVAGLGRQVDIINIATNQIVGSIPFGGGNASITGSFLSPNIIVVGGGPLLVPNDATLTSLGFGQFVDFNGGTLRLTGNLTTARTVSLLVLGGIIDTNGFSATLTGSIINSGSLTKIGAGTLVFTGNNTYTGGTTISQGTLQLGNGGTTGSILGNVSDNAVFAINRSDTFTFSGNISGTGSFQQIGSGTTILSGNNTYSGTTTVTSGTLSAGSTAGLSPNSAFVVNGTLNLNGFNSTVGSLAGSGMITNASPVAARLSVGNDNTSTTFSGTITDGTSSLALTKVGTGILTLTGANTYTGGTTIVRGTLQLGNGTASGSIIGNITNNGTLAFSHSDAYTFRGAITGTGSLVQSGTGTLTLVGNNAYSGGTVLDSGALVVDNPSALGTGDMIVNGGVLTADPQPINVKGNYFQGPNGTLQLQIAGANPGQYSYLNVTRNATLGGTLALINQNFQPQAGQSLTLIKTGGVITNTFSHFIDPFTTRPGLNAIDLVYNKQSVALEFLNLTSVTPPSQITTINFSSFAQTANQFAGAQLLNAIEFDPRASALIGYFLSRPLRDIPAELDLFSPEALSAFYEISFSNANIQRLMLENRLDALRTSSSLPSLGASPGGNAGLEKGSGDGKTTKNTVQPVLQPSPQYAFGIWANGFGDFVNLDSDFNARGYRFTTGGFDVGVDYQFLDHFAIGVVGNYAHTWTDLRPGTISVNSGRGGLYATYFNGGYYLNGGIFGGYNTFDTSRRGLSGDATGNTDGAEWSTFVSTGQDFHYGNLTIGPTASLQYTNVYVTGFSETGSLAPLQIHSDSEESLRTDLGFKASYPWQIGAVMVAPYLKAAWEHEFKYSALPVTAGLADFPGPTATFVGPAEGHNSAVLSTGVAVHWTQRVSTYAEYDGQLGRARYDSNALTGGVQVSW